MGKWTIGTDIGGSHITCQLFDLETNQILNVQKVRMAVDCHSSHDEILNTWIGAIKKVMDGKNIENISGIGFAMPGPFDYQNGVAWFERVEKFESLFGVNVREEMKKRLDLPADFPVRFLNDASCFAIGEAWIGQGSGYKRLIALTLGTGFGSTFIRNGLPVSGKEGIPDDGFLYHIPFLESVADDYFSTRWFVKEYNKTTGKQISGVKELTDHAKTDLANRKIFKTFGTNLGHFLSPWIKLFNAECIVLGGNISKSFPLFQNELKDLFDESEIEVAISVSNLDETAALFGSAKLCDDDFYEQLINPKN